MTTTATATMCSTLPMAEQSWVCWAEQGSMMFFVLASCAILLALAVPGSGPLLRHGKTLLMVHGRDRRLLAWLGGHNIQRHFFRYFYLFAFAINTAVAVAALSTSWLGQSVANNGAVILLLLQLQFGRRLYESLYVTVFSPTSVMSLPQCLVGFTYYLSLEAALCSYLATRSDQPLLHSRLFNGAVVLVCSAVFLLVSLCQFICHYQLASLRRSVILASPQRATTTTTIRHDALPSSSLSSQELKAALSGTTTGPALFTADPTDPVSSTTATTAPTTATTIATTSAGNNNNNNCGSSNNSIHLGNIAATVPAPAVVADCNNSSNNCDAPIAVDPVSNLGSPVGGSATLLVNRHITRMNSTHSSISSTGSLSLSSMSTHSLQSYEEGDPSPPETSPLFTNLLSVGVNSWSEANKSPEVIVSSHSLDSLSSTGGLAGNGSGASCGAVGGGGGGGGGGANAANCVNNNSNSNNNFNNIGAVPRSRNNSSSAFSARSRNNSNSAHLIGGNDESNSNSDHKVSVVEKLAIAAKTRTNSANEARYYPLPPSFLFELVYCPHYLCEVILYLVLVLLTGFDSLFLGNLLFVVVNLSVTAVQAKEFHVAKFAGKPSKAAIIPGIL